MATTTKKPSKTTEKKPSVKPSHKSNKNAFKDDDLGAIGRIFDPEKIKQKNLTKHV